jgi:hypothetical protein
MCLKKLFPNWFKPDPIVPPIPDTTGKTRTALLFAINNYPDSGNDLNGCLNDQKDMAKMLDSLYPGFVIKKFSDASAKVLVFVAEVTKAILALKPGDFLLVHYSGHGTYTLDPHGDEADGYDEALYLYDGTLIDDDIKEVLMLIPEGATVLLMFDSCFSDTVTRKITEVKHKFVPPFSFPSNRGLKKRIRIQKEEMRWLAFAGCGERQTSADAFINGEFHGAFTFYALKALSPGITYKQWAFNVKQYLPNDSYDQIPVLEGKADLFDRVVFT